jgi:hypothetical protein
MWESLAIIVLGGAISIVLASGPKFHGFKPGRERWIFKDDKIRSKPFFGEEAKLSAPWRNISRHVKRNPFEVWRYFVKPNSPFTSKLPPDLLLDDFARDYQKAMVDESGVFPCRHHSTIGLHAHVGPGRWAIGSLVAAVQRYGLTTSTWWSWSSSSSLAMSIVIFRLVTTCSLAGGCKHFGGTYRYHIPEGESDSFLINVSNHGVIVQNTTMEKKKD